MLSVAATRRLLPLFRRSSNAACWRRSSSRLPASQIATRLDKLGTTILAQNWADHITLVQNLSLWEAELHELEEKIGSSDTKTKDTLEKKLRHVHDIFDCLTWTSHVRDHLSEIMEANSRASGIAGTGLGAAFQGVENLNEHAEAGGQVYAEMLAVYPQFAPKIEDTVGQAVMLIRQKIRFPFAREHYHFF